MLIISRHCAALATDLRGETLHTIRLDTNKWKLKWKIFVFLLGFCALLLAILWMFQTVFLDTFYKNIRVMEIKRDANIIAQNLENNSLVDIIADISKNTEISVDITDLDGQSILTPFLLQDRRMIAENLSLITRAQTIDGEFYEYNRTGPLDDNRILLSKRGLGRQPAMQSLTYVKLTQGSDGKQSAIMIRAVISPVNATVATLRYQLYFISAIMIFLAVILAVVIANRVSRPIEDISQSAAVLAKGHYDVRFDGQGFYEIVALSETLNAAAFELGRVESLRRELLANVSHDLRTPLALIYSYSEMMHDFPAEITAEQTQIIMDETRRLTTLVNDVLDISKLEADMETLLRSRWNFTQHIRETTERLCELLKTDGFEITFSYSEDAYVDADKTKISRAFYNLLINAVNYSADSRVIHVTQTIEEDHVRIDVKDHGEGIAQDALPFIWDRYYKSGKTHKRAVTGTGLGLSIVKKVIELHDGRYGVTSQLGEGSLFWFSLPVSPDPSASENPAPTVSPDV